MNTAQSIAKGVIDDISLSGPSQITLSIIHGEHVYTCIATITPVWESVDEPVPTGNGEWRHQDCESYIADVDVNSVYVECDGVHVTDLNQAEVCRAVADHFATINVSDLFVGGAL